MAILPPRTISIAMISHAAASAVRINTLYASTFPPSTLHPSPDDHRIGMPPGVSFMLHRTAQFPSVRLVAREVGGYDV